MKKSFAILVAFLVFINSTFAAALQNYYNESTAESSYNADTNYQDKVVLSFTPDENSAYAIIGSWLLNGNSTSLSSQGKLARTSGTPKDFNEQIIEPTDTGDYVSGFTFGVDTFESSPGEQTYKIQYTTNSTSATASIKSARLIAVKLDAADQYAVAESRTTAADYSTWVDKLTKTFTPDSQDDYIILAVADVDHNSTSSKFNIQLNVDGVNTTITKKEPQDISSRYSWGTVRKYNLTAASHTIKIQFKPQSPTSRSGCANARVVAIKAANLENVYYNESNAFSSYATDTNYQDKSVLTQTPEAVNHLIMGGAAINGTSTSYASYVKLIETSTDIAVMNADAKDTSNRAYPYFTLYKGNLTAESATWKTQYKTENTENTVGIEDSRICVIQLDEAPAVTVEQPKIILIE